MDAGRVHCPVLIPRRLGHHCSHSLGGENREYRRGTRKRTRGQYRKKDSGRRRRGVTFADVPSAAKETHIRQAGFRRRRDEYDST
jgi:hypothetical protein